MLKVIVKFTLLLMLSASPVSGQVVEDTNINVNASAGAFALIVFQGLEFGMNGDPTGVSGSVLVTGTTATLLFSNTGLDEGSDWFATNQSDPFTRGTIDAGQFSPLVAQADNGFLFGSLDVEVDESFFLGVNTGNGFVDEIDFEPNRQHFGWGEFLVNQNGELQLLDSAVAYNQNGIFIGENVAIPEPSSGVLILVGAAVLPSRRRRLKH